MHWPTFLKEEKYKLLATIFVAGFFIYFWTNGPLNQTSPLLDLEVEETEFARPKLVDHTTQRSNSTFGTIEESETKGHGHGLMVDKQDAPKTHALITDEFIGQSSSQAFTEKLLAHAEHVLKEPVNLKVTEQLYYAQAISGNAIYLESIGLTNDIHGYAGPLNIGLIIDKQGRIQHVQHVSSKETKSYLKKIADKGFYERLAGFVLKGKQTVDAVSGATITTEAIAKTVSALSEKAMPEPLVTFADASEMDPFHVTAKLNWWWTIHISVIFLMFLYGFQKKLRKTKRGLIILSILSVVYIGFFLNNSFTYLSFVHPFVGTALSSFAGLYALFVLLGAVWGKNTYCKYVCPFGNAQRLILQISPKKMRAKFFLSNQWLNRIRLAIAMILLAGVLLGLRSWGNFELFPDLFGIDLRAVWFFIAAIAVLFTARYPMIWCRLLCPTGSILDLISELVETKKKKRKPKILAKA